MADYYPLLARAVSAQTNASKETRQGIYDRARKALLGQLRSQKPALSEEDIRREAKALDDAIVQVESELQRPEVSSASRKTAHAIADETGGFQVPPRSMTLAERAKAHRENLASGGAARKSPEKPPKAAPEPPPPVAPLVVSSPPPAATVAPPVRAPEPPFATKPPSAAVRGEKGHEVQTFAPIVAPSTVADVEAPPVHSDAPPVHADAKPIISFPAESKSIPQSGLLWKFGRSRSESDAAEGAGASRAAKDVEDRTPSGKTRPSAGDEDFGDESGALSPTQGGARSEPLRPLAPLVRAEQPGSGLYWALGAAAALIVVGVAVLAFMFKDTPQTVDADKGTPAVTEKVQSKIIDRIGVGPTHMASVGAAVGSLETQTPASSTGGASQAPNVATAQQITPASAVTDASVAVAQRAALLVQSPTSADSQGIATFVGTVVWSLDQLPAVPGQPQQTAVRAAIDIPDAHFKATMLLEKNNDPSLPASHTIELRFIADPGSIVGDVKQVDTLQMRKEDSPAGDPLSGIPTAITANYFLIGLTKGDPAQAHNIELMQGAGWFDVPMLLTNGKIAKITFEKGVAGAKVLSAALSAWGN